MGPNPNGPRSVSCDRAMKDTQIFLGSVDRGSCFEFSWIRLFRKISSILTVVWSKEQIVNLERFGAALLVTSECTLAAGHKKAAGFGGWRSRGHSDEQIFWKIPRVMGGF